LRELLILSLNRKLLIVAIVNIIAWLRTLSVVIARNLYWLDLLARLEINIRV